MRGVSRLQYIQRCAGLCTVYTLRRTLGGARLNAVWGLVHPGVDVRRISVRSWRHWATFAADGYHQGYNPGPSA